MKRSTELKIDTFNSLLRHYLALVLERAGVPVLGDVRAELDNMRDSLKEALMEIADDKGGDTSD